jgi:hypothetical protein
LFLNVLLKVVARPAVSDPVLVVVAEVVECMTAHGVNIKSPPPPLFVREHGVHAGPKDYFVVVVVVVVICGSI